MKNFFAILITLLFLCSCTNMDLDERNMIVQYKQPSATYDLCKYTVNIQGANVYRTIMFTAPKNMYNVGDTLTFRKK